MILKIIFFTVIIFLILFFAFLWLNPRFGKSPNKEQIKEYEKLENYEDGKFINKHESSLDINYFKIFKKIINNSSAKHPSKNIEVEKLVLDNDIKNNISRLVWFGHSTFLLELDGKRILIDPMFGNRSSPVSFAGAKRYSRELPVEIENLPFIDIVLISHDHYDHLDYDSINKLKGKVGKYFVPLGVSGHLERWGISKQKITELNWWEKVNFKDIELICAPARHFSGRGVFDRSKTLWSSWIISGNDKKIFFSGDSGYDAHFKEIGEKYGPFDIALMECGQYDETWKFLHMTPEETVEASLDLKAKLTLPIHWGGFTLSFHEWTDPIERILVKASELKVLVTTPKIGEVLNIGDKNFPKEKWWKEYE